MNAKKVISIASIYLVAAVVGLGIGFAILDQARPSPKETNATPKFATDQNMTGQNRAPSASANPQTRSEPSFVAGWAHRVPIDEIPRWVKHFSNNANRDVLETLLVRWAKSDPAAAMEVTLALPPTETKSVREYEDDGWSFTSMSSASWMLIEVARTWLRDDPDAAMSAILAIPDEAVDRGELLRYTLRTYAMSRPAEAARVAFDERGELDLGGGKSGLDRSLVSSIFNYWGVKDPHSAIARAETLADRSLRDEAVESAFEGWNKANPGTARQWFDALEPNDQTRKLREAMLSSLGKTDPVRALELSFENDPEEDSGRSMIAWYWSNRDAEGMLRAVGEVEEPALRSVMVTRAFEKLADIHSGTELAEMAMGLPADMQQTGLKNIARRWAQQDAAAAETWGLELEDPILRRQFLREFYSWKIGSLPAEVAANIDRIPDKNLRGVIAVDTANRWSQENPAEAAAWIVSSLPEGVTPDAMLQLHQLVARQFTRRSPEEAIEWFATLEDDAVRQAASQEIAWGLQESDADGAALINAANDISEDDRKVLLERLSSAKTPGTYDDPFAR